MDLTANMGCGKWGSLASSIIEHLTDKSRLNGHNTETKTSQQETTNTTHTSTGLHYLSVFISVMHFFLYYSQIHLYSQMSDYVILDSPFGNNSFTVICQSISILQFKINISITLLYQRLAPHWSLLHYSVHKELAAATICAYTSPFCSNEIFLRATKPMLRSGPW